MQHSDNNKLKTVSEQRSLLMGLSILYIVLYHQYFVQDFPIQPFARFGGWGVEIFMFLSGIGIAYSLGKNRLGKYFANRFSRIIPAYGIALLILTWLLYQEDGALDHGDAEDIVNHWWFIKSIILFYLLAPILRFILQKWSWKGFLAILAVDIALLFLPEVFASGGACICDWKRIWNESATRLPAFLLGMAMVVLPASQEPAMGKAAKIALVPLLLAAAVFRIATAEKTIGSIPDWMILHGGLRTWVFDMQRLLICFLSPVICYVIARILAPIRSWLLLRFVSFCGVISLELYLMHELVFVNGAGLHSWIPMSGAYAWCRMLLAILLSLLSAWGLHWICGLPSQIRKKRGDVDTKPSPRG